MSAITVSALYVYPIKSCRGHSIDSAEVNATGLRHDRRWQLVDNDGAPVTQREKPVLATVQPELTDVGLSITAEGHPTLEVSNPTATSRTVSSLLGMSVEVADAGDEAADWFSTLLEAPTRLVGLVDDGGCGHPPAFDYFDQHVAFSDAAPVLLTNQASLEWLQERAGETFAMDRFRPNIVVTGAQAWAEDRWSSVRIGEAHVRVVFPWPRCAIPQIDQVSGKRHKEPARVLKSHRWCAPGPAIPETSRQLIEGNSLFGLGCSIGPAESELHVGDAVEIEQTMEPVITMDV